MTYDQLMALSTHLGGPTPEVRALRWAIADDNPEYAIEKEALARLAVRWAEARRRWHQPFQHINLPNE